MSTDGQGTKHRRKIAENYNRLSIVHERYRRQTDRQTTSTDGRATAYSEREREFIFAKNWLNPLSCLWSPYVIGQTIIFLPSDFYLSFFFSSPNLSRRRLDVYHTSTHGVALVRI